MARFITRNSDRRLIISNPPNPKGASWWIEILERERYVSAGYSKAKWTSESVMVTRDELKKIAEAHGFDVIDKEAHHA